MNKPVTTEKPVMVEVSLDGPELTEYDDDKTLIEFIDELTEVLDTVPEAHRKEAMIKCSGEYTTYTHIKYDRPETDEEKGNRLAREATKRSENERRDREQLAKLKARYEN